MEADSETAPEESMNPERKAESPKKELSSSEIEKNEEAKLKAKYPQAVGGGLGGHSAFLQKKLAKGGTTRWLDKTFLLRRNKHFKQTYLILGLETRFPTPESVPVRKTSIIQPKFHPSLSPPNANSNQ